MNTIIITGCSGLVGTHLCTKLTAAGHVVYGLDLYKSDNLPKTNNFNFLKVDLRNFNEVSSLFADIRADGVINAFGVKGSPIRAKERPLDFLEPSIKANINIIENCYANNMWLVYMSSVGVYSPAEEFVEDTVWNTLPSSNDWFPSWSKRIPELYLEAYKTQHNWKNWSIVRPANIFGEYDDFTGNGTVIASTIKKVYEANTEITAWGDGTPTRDFIYAGDVADACIHCLLNKLHIITNLGSGEEISIKRMVETVIEASNKNIKINWDITKPNGDMKRKMSIKRQSNYGLLPKLGFKEGIKITYNYYEKNR